ncbi:MAG: SDR family NAD(P)-dependent oxidoreductase [Hamadaea sp.]|nr:SDR family NAD(P)-dependent oxidoreductase [Hamadaea sp.]NUT19086.1 SDR family NAD(P)-dependent oxidoreductase [Hamadaea sp.]
MTEPTTEAVLVTGAAGGIGAAAVRSLAGHGMRVYATVRGDDETSRSLAKIANVRLITMDVSEPASVEAAVETIRRESPALRAVVNNAGVIVQGPLELVPPAELRRQFEVNTFGPAYVVQAFLPLLRAGGGRIVNVGAPTGRVAMPFLGPISASKAALESFSNALRLELAAWNIPVSVIEPGSTQTRIFDKAGSAEKAARRLSDPQRVRLYADHLARMDKAQAAMKQDPVQPVADAIVHAVIARTPKRRYVVGGARAIGLLLKMPTGLRERLLMSSLGLRGVAAGR